MNHNKFNNILIYLIAIIIGAYAGIQEHTAAITMAELVSNYFVSCLKWLSIPLISFSLLSTTKNLQSKGEFFRMGGHVLIYTLATTICAAFIALGFFLLIRPYNPALAQYASEYSFIVNNNVFGYWLIGSLFGTLIFCLALITLPTNLRLRLNDDLELCHAFILWLVNFVLSFMPLAIWAFVVLFFHELDMTMLTSLSKYLACIILANLTQASLILPLILYLKKIPIIPTFKAVLPALAVAFWSKSSAVALPVVLKSMDNTQVKRKNYQFCLPLCITINMNACAAFIIITILFTSMSHGANFNIIELSKWTLIASLAAVGNAGVPMGCYTLACAIIGIMGYPLYLLGLILPVYTLIDMLESAINVWSDVCVTCAVDADLSRINPQVSRNRHSYNRAQQIKNQHKK